MIRPTDELSVLDGVRRFGVAQGPKKLMVLEGEAAAHAIRTGVYATWRSHRKGGDACTRVGPRSICFCGHTYAEHWGRKGPRKPCSHGRTRKAEARNAHAAANASEVAARRKVRCRCPGFAFMPSRPEEVGDYWLTRRRGFNVNTWRCKCKCGHTHEEHDPKTRRCRTCGCGTFQSNFLCVVCDKHWEDHETVFENERERRAAGLPVGNDFFPLSCTPEIQRAVFTDTRNASSTAESASARPARSLEDRWQSGEISAQEYQRLVLAAGASSSQSHSGGGSAVTTTTSASAAPATNSQTGGVERRRFQLTRPHPTDRRPERSVRLSHISSGGAARGRVVNRWGKVETAHR